MRKFKIQIHKFQTPQRMLQLNYHSYISVKYPIKKWQEEENLMDIANPILNLEKQRNKGIHISSYLGIWIW